jgi:hypothetical protein
MSIRRYRIQSYGSTPLLTCDSGQVPSEKFIIILIHVSMASQVLSEFVL